MHAGALVTFALVASACGRLGFDSASTDKPLDGRTEPDGSTDAFAPPANCNGPFTTTFDELPATWSPRSGGGIQIFARTGTLVLATDGTADEEGVIETPDSAFTNRSIAMHLQSSTVREVSLGIHDRTINQYIHAKVIVPTLIVDRLFASGDYMQLASRPFDPVADAWLRIAEVGGTIEVATSPNGIDWALVATSPTFDLSNGFADIGMYSGPANPPPGEAVITETLDCTP